MSIFQLENHLLNNMNKLPPRHVSYPLDTSTILVKFILQVFSVTHTSFSFNFYCRFYERHPLLPPTFSVNLQILSKMCTNSQWHWILNILLTFCYFPILVYWTFLKSIHPSYVKRCLTKDIHLSLLCLRLDDKLRE